MKKKLYNIEFERETNEEEKKRIVAEYKKAIKRFSDALGISVEDFFFQGRMKIVFADDEEQRLATYQVKQKTIYIFKDGSLAHEWFHCLDNFYCEDNGEAEWPFSTDSFQSGMDFLYEGFTDLLKTIYDCQDYIRRSVDADLFYKLDHYFTDNSELCARAFAVYIASILGTDQILVSGNVKSVFPRGEERKLINEKIRDLFCYLQDENYFEE